MIPSWQARRFLCLKCRHPWGDWIAVGVTVEVFVAALRALRCPRCGSRKITFDLAAERAEMGSIEK